MNKVRKGKKPLVEFRLISVTAQKRDLPSIPHGDTRLSTAALEKRSLENI